MNAPFRGSAAIAAGVLSRDSLKTTAWRRLLRDVYVRSDVVLTHLIRCQAAALVLPQGAAISGRSAAYLHGCAVLQADAPVEVSVTTQIRGRPGVRVRRASLTADDVMHVGGLAVTTPARTAFDVARTAALEDAVVTIDALVNLRRVSIDDVHSYAADRSAWPGANRAQRAFALAAAGAESPMESRLRLLLVRSGLPTPVLQHGLRDERGVPAARLDMAYVAQRLGIEYDGECHFDARASRRDIRRQNALRSLGWSLFRFNSDDVLRHPARVVDEVRSALARL